MPHILIVEDETIIRSALRRLLERNQYQVSEAGSVQEAQERFSIPTFDLIVSDLRLPGAPGTELIKLGVHSVLNKSEHISHLIFVHSCTLRGATYFREPHPGNDLNPAQTRTTRRLSRREAEVIRLYVSGRSVNEIASEFNRSKQTISSQKTSAHAANWASSVTLN